MRIFILILSLIFSAAFVFLNILGFNGILTFNEFFLVNVIAEVLVCLVLGHFMHRTYANRKKLKKLQQEMTTRQASTVAQEQTAKKKHSLTLKKKADTSKADAPSSQPPMQQPTAPRAPQAPAQQPTAPRAPQAPAQQPTAPRAPQAPTQQPTAPRAPQAPAQQPTAPRAPQAPTQQPTAPQQDPRRAPVREQITVGQTRHQPPSADTTQPLQPIRTKTDDMDSTTLYTAPFGK